MFAALTSKPSVLVYTNDKEYRKVFSFSKRIVLTTQPRDADIILITNEMMLRRVLTRGKMKAELNENTILFVTDYRYLEESKDIVGAFYSRKGRTQLLFIKERLKAKKITLPAEYQHYMIDEL